MVTTAAASLVITPNVIHSRAYYHYYTIDTGWFDSDHPIIQLCPFIASMR